MLGYVSLKSESRVMWRGIQQWTELLNSAQVTYSMYGQTLTLDLTPRRLEERL